MGTDLIARHGNPHSQECNWIGSPLVIFLINNNVGMYDFANVYDQPYVCLLALLICFC